MIVSEELSSNLVCDKLAQSYNLDLKIDFNQYMKWELLDKYARSHQHALDIGIANGIYSLPLARKVRKIDGIDISQSMIDKCKDLIKQRQISNINLSLQSATNLEFPDNNFDLVFSFSTIVLVPNAAKVILETSRVLKPGGIAILDITGKYNLSQIFWRRYYQKHGHFGISSFSLSNIMQKFADTGLNVAECHAFGVLDQWQYLPFINRISWKRSKAYTGKPNIDYLISNRFKPFANRWYFVVQKK